MGLKEIIENFSSKTILVIGDITLDNYIHGRAIGLSTEAPVPEISVENEEFKFGGAANLADNILNMGGKVFLGGVVGNDDGGNNFLKEMKKKGLATDGVFVLEGRPTTTTTRIITDGHHVVRILKENVEDIDDETSEKILSYIKRKIDSSDVLVFSDHNKGVITSKLLEESIKIAKEDKKPIVADPSYRRFFDYIGVDVFKPVDREASKMTGIKIINESSLRNICLKLLSQLNCNQVMITSGKFGTVSFEKNGNFIHLDSNAKSFLDTIGEGDSSTAAFSLGLVSGNSLKEALEISNYTTGIKVGKIGTAVVTKDELLAKINESAN